MNKFLCQIGFHKYLDVKIQYTKNIRFGFSGCEMPGVRLIQYCKHCNKRHYMRLSLFMPSRFLYDETIWN